MTPRIDAPAPALAPARRSRRVRTAGLVALASLVAYAIVGLPFFVFPAVDPVPVRADVAYVLGPATPERIATAEGLLADGTVDHVLMSVPRAADDPGGTTPDRHWVRRCAAMADTTCVVAKPYTTQGEARLLRSIGAERGWSSAVVITQSAHLARARTIVGRCWSGGVVMRPSGEAPSGGWPYQYAYQTAATLKAWFVTNTC